MVIQHDRYLKESADGMLSLRRPPRLEVGGIATPAGEVVGSHHSDPGKTFLKYR